MHSIKSQPLNSATAAGKLELLSKKVASIATARIPDV
jgi:hypothetical protein